MPLTAEEREVLARLELLAHGSTQRFDPTGGATGNHAPPAPGPLSAYPHLYWKAQILTASTDYKRQVALECAKAELGSWRRQATRPSAPVESWAELKDRVVSEGKGWSVREVANHCRCSERQVVKARNEAAVSVDDGRDLRDSHGTVRAYKRGCQCASCRAAWAQQARDRRAA